MHICTVYFRNAQGEAMAGHVTEASSLFGAAQRALDWFESRHWQGPRPRPETILEIKTASNPERCYYVRAGRVPRETIKQGALFERNPDGLEPKR